MAEFDLLHYLTEMERRLNDRLGSIENKIDKTNTKVEETSEKTVALEGRIVNLEEKAGWIKAGLGTALLAAITSMIFHIKEWLHLFAAGK